MEKKWTHTDLIFNPLDLSVVICIQVLEIVSLFLEFLYFLFAHFKTHSPVIVIDTKLEMYCTNFLKLRR